MNKLQDRTYPKIGLALSGGSALGNVHIGVLQAFEDHHMPIGCIAGTSAGAVVAACYAFGVPVAEMAERAKNLNWFKLSNLSYSRMGLASTQAIGKFMEEILGPVNIEDAKIPLAIVAADIQTGERVVFRKGKASQAIMASVCIPGLFAPVEADGKVLVDGGLVENLPLLPLDGMGAEFKIGVDLSRFRTYKRPESVIDVMLNTLDIMTYRQTALSAHGADFVLEPHLEGYSTSDFKKSAELVAEGYRAATLAVPKIMELLAGPAAQPQTIFQRIVRWLR